MPLDDAVHGAVDAALAVCLCQLVVQLSVAQRAELQPGAVTDETLGRDDVIACRAVARRVGAPGVVRVHSPYRAAIERGWIGREAQAQGLQSAIEIGRDHAGLHCGCAVDRILFQHVAQVA